MTKIKKELIIVVVFMLAFSISAFCKESPQRLVNINEDSIEVLVTLPGVGPGLARRIVEYRENMRFEKIEDILNVIGVGPGNFSKFKDAITVGND